MFFGREEELKSMNKRYDKGKFECAIIYGRRRVGKTSLITEFCKGKPAIYFFRYPGLCQRKSGRAVKGTLRISGAGQPSRAHLPILFRCL